MQKYIILALLLGGFFRLNSSAQSFAELYDGYQQADSIKSGELKLRFEGVGFFQNNEYVGDLLMDTPYPAASSGRESAMP
jgi:hypothetical protein